MQNKTTAIAAHFTKKNLQEKLDNYEKTCYNVQGTACAVL